MTTTSTSPLSSRSIVQGFPENGKIAIFLHHLGGGGVERVMVNLMQELVNLNIPVDLVIVSLTGPHVTAVPRQVRIVNLNKQRVSRAIWPLAQYLKREKPTALLTALTHTNVAAVLANVLSGTRTPVVVSERNHISLWYKRGQHPLLVRLSHRLRPWAYRRTHAIISISNGVGDDLARLTGIDRQRIVTIYNPTVTPDMLARSQEPVDHPWFAPGQPPVILGVGRLVDQKNFPLLLDAFHQVRQQRQARLVILGEGENRSALEAQIRRLGIEQDVLLPGFVANPYAWMKHSSVFVLSSDFEGLGNVLIEAMACGTSVVSTACPSGPEEILNHGQVGRLVPVNDQPALTAAILETLEHPQDPQALMERARVFSSAVIARQYLQLLVPGVRIDA
jgi:glycosyltransferase involved in cell wall biosynthesis